MIHLRRLRAIIASSQVSEPWQHSCNAAKQVPQNQFSQRHTTVKTPSLICVRPEKNRLYCCDRFRWMGVKGSWPGRTGVTMLPRGDIEGPWRALAVLLGSFLEPEDIKCISLGAIWNLGKVTGLPWFDMGHKGPFQKGLGASGVWGPGPKFNLISRWMAWLTSTLGLLSLVPLL
jgi:hypothetical protein